MDNDQQWQPIETAPKDGTKILVFTEYKADDEVGRALEIPPFDMVQIASWITAFEGDPNNEFSKWDLQALGTPTHWMPLPKAPK